MPTTDFDTWKTQLLAKEADLSAHFAAFPGTPCNAGEQLTGAMNTWKSAHGVKIADVVAHGQSMPTVVCELPPQFNGQPGWLVGKSWSLAGTYTISNASQLSGIKWHRGRNTLLLLNESNQIIECSLTGTVIRRITLTNPPTTADYESLTIISENPAGDLIGIGHEGIGYGTPPTVTGHVLTIELPHGTSDISLSLAGATKLDLPAVGSDYEAICWDAGHNVIRWVRQEASRGTLALDGTLVTLARQNPVRYNTNDCDLNPALTPNPLWFGGYRYLQERDEAANSVVAQVDLDPLIGYHKWEGFTITDSGSIFICGEKVTGNLVRLDLN